MVATASTAANFTVWSVISAVLSIITALQADPSSLLLPWSASPHVLSCLQFCDILQHVLLQFHEISDICCLLQVSTAVRNTVQSCRAQCRICLAVDLTEMTAVKTQS
jgi:hypothetical protein